MKTQVQPYYQLKRIFDDPEECLTYLKEKLIIPHELNCIECGIDIKIKKYDLFECPNRKYTIFMNSRLPCNKLLELGYLWLIKMSHGSITKFTGMAETTITRWTHAYRIMITKEIKEMETKIGGPGIIVEIDESLFWKTKDGNTVWVFGGKERTPEKKIFATIVNDRSQETLLYYIWKYIHPGSIIYSDMWKGYTNIYTRLGIQHHIVNHGHEFSTCEYDEIFNRVPQIQIKSNIGSI